MTTKNDSVQAAKGAAASTDVVSGTMSKESATKANKPTQAVSSSSKAGKNNRGNSAVKEPLQTFFLDSLKDILWAENAILESLPKMRQAATTEELQDAFEDHELQTRKQISRLEKAFRLLGERAESKKCDAMAGIIKECEHIKESTPEGSMTRDAALIIAAQKVEHYEIASYGGLVQLAITLGHNEVADLLEQTLEEEEDTDHDLTEIAESFINFEAAEEGDDEETED